MIFGRRKKPSMDGALLALAEALKALTFETREQNKLLRHIMIAQTTIDTTLAGLTAEVQRAVALIPTAANSTPDAAVQGLVDGVNAQTAALTAVLPPTPPAAPAS